MGENYAQADRFNPTPTSIGMEIFEHWERDGGQNYLIAVSATPAGMQLKPGDTIIRRRWAPASNPIVYNRARSAPAEEPKEKR